MTGRSSTFETFDRTAALLGRLHAVRGDGLGELRGWRSWEVSSRAVIIASPQRAVRPRRLVLPRATAADWIIHDVTVNAGEARRSMVASGQGMPGGLFTPEDAQNMDLPPVITGAQIVVTVEYVGADPNGAEFQAVFLCDAVDGGKMALPLVSAGPIFSDERTRELGSGRRIGIQIDDRAWVFRQDRRVSPFSLSVEDSELRGEVASMDELMHLDTDDGAGSSMRSGEPRPVGPQGARRPANAPFKLSENQRRELSEWNRGIVRQPIEVPHLWSVRPRVLSFHVIGNALAYGSAIRLFGLDETTNRVVFEIVLDDGDLTGRFDKSGYTPTWWNDLTG